MTHNKKRTMELLKVQNKTEEHFTELVKLNTGLVYKLMNSYNLTHDDDAYSYGLEALYKAIIAEDLDELNLRG